MFTTRLLRTRACLVLAGFVLAVAAATLSPWLRPSALMWVCGADGHVRLVNETGGNPAAPGHAHALDCALCLPACAPPPARVALPGRPPLPQALRPAGADERVGPRPQARAPLPPRGPPAV
ncbi:DUF2946 domain-containing protein [Comamonadaceae bacterium OH2545_COT-014]|nr:DUF2946 domain-containing protein [Comamonadaceae bacterium OH2545_COT-014]